MVERTATSVNRIEKNVNIENQVIRQIQKHEGASVQLAHMKTWLEEFEIKLLQTESWITNCRSGNCVLTYDTR